MSHRHTLTEAAAGIAAEPAPFGTIASARCKGEPVCTLVIAVYASQPW